MPLIGVLQTMVDGAIITAAQHNSNYADIKSAFNTSAVLTDVTKTITVTHLWNASQTFAGGASFAAAVTSTSSFTATNADGVVSLSGSGFTGTFTGAAARLALALNNNRGSVALDRISIQLGFSLGYLGGIDAMNENTGNNRGSLILRTGTGVGGLLQDVLTLDSNMKATFAGEVVIPTFVGTFKMSTAVSKIVPGATSLAFRNNADSADNLLITNAGIVALRGVTQLAGSGVGNLVLANAKAIMGENAAGTNTLPLIMLNAAGRVEIDPNANDIQFGTNRPALGGGAVPTLGTIGGAGPAVAAQNAWLKFYDAGGIAIFVPFWK